MNNTLVLSLLTAATWLASYIVTNTAITRNYIKPSLGFWTTLVFLNSVIVVSLFFSGVHDSSITQPVLWLFGSISVFAFTLRQHGAFRLNKVEVACLILALVGIVAWGVSGNPRVSVLILVPTFIIASVPSWQNGVRGNDSWKTNLLPVTASFLGIGTVHEWTIAAWPNWTMPLLAVLANSFGLLCAYLGNRKFPDGASSS